MFNNFSKMAFLLLITLNMSMFGTTQVSFNIDAENIDVSRSTTIFNYKPSIQGFNVITMSYELDNFPKDFKLTKKDILLKDRKEYLANRNQYLAKHDLFSNLLNPKNYAKTINVVDKYNNEVIISIPNKDIDNNKGNIVIETYLGGFKSKYSSNELIKKLYDAKELSLQIEFYTPKYTTIKEKFENPFYMPSLPIPNQKKFTYKNIKYVTPTQESIYIPIKLDQDFKSIKKTWLEDSESSTSRNKTSLLVENIMVLIGVIITLIFFYYLIKLFKKLLIKLKNKKNDFLRKNELRKIRKIAEEEAIKENVRKSISDKSDDDLVSLQKLINEAVATGDTETAKTLLKILEKKKQSVDKK